MATNNPVDASAQGMQYQSSAGVWSGIDASTAAYILTSNGTGVAPSFQAAPSGGGDVSGPGSSTDRAIATWNGTGGTDLYNNSSVIINSSGYITNSSQPSFFAYLSSTLTDVTGDGTNYTIPFNSTLFNRSSSFNTGTGVFTAPVTGIYKFDVSIYMIDLTGAMTLGLAYLNTTAASYLTTINIGAVKNSFNQASMSFSATVPMTATDTAFCSIQISNGAKVADVYTVSSSDPRSFFSGYLVC